LTSSLLPFAIPEAGFDYFATQAHYRSLAARILTALGGFNVVVVTGDRLSSGEMVGTALGEAAAGRYKVISFQHEPKQARQEAMRVSTALSASLPCGSATDRDTDVPALLVFHDLDRYSDKQIEKILTLVHERAPIADHRITAAVFLATTEFLTRLEHPVFRVWVAERLLVARLRFHELGAGEIPAFIRRQLPSREAEKIFTDAAIAAIANVSGGDPVVVNRFSRRMLEGAPASIGNTFAKADFGSATEMSQDPPPKERDVETVADRLRQNFAAPETDLPLSTRMWRAAGVKLKLGAGIGLSLTCVAVVITAVAFVYPGAEDIAASKPPPAIDMPRKPPEHASLAGGAPPDPAIPPTTEGPTPLSALTAMTASAEPPHEDAVADKTPAQPPSAALLRSSDEPAAPTEAAKAILDATIPSAASTEVAPTAATVSPTGMRASSPISSTPDQSHSQRQHSAAEAMVSSVPSTEVAPTATPTGMHVPSSTPLTPLPRPAQLRFPEAEIAALLARGDASFALGDLSSARLFYERAADAGEGRAALRLGHTYDPVFLDFANLHVRGDAAVAESWYRRARELGETEAELLLTTAHRHHQDGLTAAQRRP
jgi:hypothetical protein